MYILYRLLNFVLMPLALNVTVIPAFRESFSGGARIAIYIIIGVYYLIFSIMPSVRKCPSLRLKIMDGGNELLLNMVVTAIFSIGWVTSSILLFSFGNMELGYFIAHLVILAAGLFVMFWNGIIRIYCTSAQLGIKLRVLGIILGFVPIANIVMLIIIFGKSRGECRREINRARRNEARAEKQVCKTKYPILLVHGVFFRDSKLLNYWGRIPEELERNGAKIYYGEQQSAASVSDSAEELAERIKYIVKKTGCEKVNIIAHSKGGLDSRYAISKLDCAKYVASLTTINTPHQGCIFAEYLLNNAPEAFVKTIEDTYNAAFRRLGDINPDFLAAVRSLTNSACQQFNKDVPNAEGVVYQSVGSRAARARSGKFPLNVSYPIVKKFDGPNDGLVALSAQEWGESFTQLIPKGRHGITHADVIDLNRVDFKDFDVREFYVEMVSKLRERGL